MEKLTVKQVLEITIQNLESIMVPAGLTEQIAIPIAQNANNLRECIKSLESSGVMTKHQDTAEETEEPEPGMEPLILPVNNEEAEDGRKAGAE